MDKELLEANNAKITETLKALNKALSKEDNAKKALASAREEVRTTKESYVLALDEAKKIVA